MKKLSFILALLIAACAVLASCGDASDSSTAESSRSESNNESSADESSVDESSQSSENTESKPAESGTQVISKGCSYEVPGGKGYVVNDDKWPANYTADLTDGVAYDKLAYDNSWFSFNSEPDIDGEANRIDGVGIVIIDLGAEKEVTGVRTNVYTGNEASIAPVGSVVVSFSTDGESYADPVSLTVPPLNSVGWAEGECESTKARYVKVEYTVGGTGHHMFTNEIEVYGN